MWTRQVWPAREGKTSHTLPRTRQPICGEGGLIIRLHLLFGEVRSVTTALKVEEEVQEGLQEIEREWEEEEVGWNGELKVEE